MPLVLTGTPKSDTMCRFRMAEAAQGRWWNLDGGSTGAETSVKLCTPRGPNRGTIRHAGRDHADATVGVPLDGHASLGWFELSVADLLH